jgi:hypothetical protein
MAVAQLGLINNRSPSIHKPWKISPHPFGHLNQCGLLSYSPTMHFHTTNLRKGTIDITHIIPPDTQSDEAIESLPLLNTESGRRPYQAYCVTEPPSRAPSPDMLIPRPLRIRAPPDQPLNPESRHVPSDALLQVSTAPTGKNDNLAIIPRQNCSSSAQQESSNQRTWSQDIMLEHQHHITQAVTARGSHPLMASQTAMYDRTPPHLRMQQTPLRYVATSLSYQQKPLPQHVNTVAMDSRPLPPLPDETLDAPDLETSQWADNLLLNGNAEQALRVPRALIETSEDDQLGGSLPVVDYNSKVLHIPPEVPQEVEGYVDDYEELFQPRVGYQINPAPPSFHEPRSDILPRSHNTFPAQSRYLDEPVRPPSSTSSYIPRGLFSDIGHDTRAFRRTEPKDAKLKYQFGRRPSLRLFAPLPPPLHTSISQPIFPHPSSLSNTQRFARPISPSYTDGPRPPPWGSIDELQVQRQSRSEARERHDARKYRMSLGSKGSSSTESLRGAEMRREVEEYKAQVLRVYPDMEFDGEAGKGGRECACNVM